MANLLTGIIPAACVLGAFALIYVANTMFGVINNCVITKTEKFSFAKFMQPFLKVFLAAFTMAVIVFSFNLISLGLDQFGEISVSDTVLSIISIGTFIMLFTKGFIITAVDVYGKIRDLFEIKDNTTFDTEAVANMAISRPADEYNTDTVDHEVKGVG